MKIDTIKQLDKLLALCQKRGVTSITIDGVSLTIAQKATTNRNTVRHIDTNVFPEETIKVPVYNPGNISEDTKIETPDELTEEQLMFYSAMPETPSEQVN